MTLHHVIQLVLYPRKGGRLARTGMTLRNFIKCASGVMALALITAAGAIAHPDDTYWDAAFGANAADSRVEALYFDGDDLYAGGYFDNIGGITAASIARWDGSNWHAVGAGLGDGKYDGVSEILVYDAVVYAGGRFITSGGAVFNHIARWNGSNWLPLGSGLTDVFFIPAVTGMAAFQGDIYVGGGIRRAGAVPVNGLARWDGDQWRDSGVPSDPFDDYPAIWGMATDNDYLYVAGQFRFGDDVWNFARWDGYEWSAIHAAIAGDCRDIAVVGSDLFVAGWFFTRGPGEQVNNIGRWDGTNWHAMDGGTNDMVMSVFPVGGNVYIAGNFTRAGGKAASRVAVWDGTDWRPLGSGVDLRTWTFSVAARENGEVFVGGDHDTAGGIVSPRVARWYNPVPYPANPFPPQGARNQMADIQLTWGTSGATGTPDQFDLYFGTTTNPPLVVTGLTSGEFSPDTLYNDTQYYWKVVSRNDSGDHATGSVWTFRTEDLVTSRLIVSSASGRCETAPDTVLIDISIEDCDVPIDAAGLDLPYDPSVLTFLHCEAGDLTQGWQHFECADLGTFVRVGGFDTTPIPQSSYGLFARLFFISDCCGVDSTVSYALTPVNLTDDLAGLRGISGAWTCEYFVADGDINNDGYITSGDAYCTFDTYLSYPDPLPNDCGASGWDIRSDVDCSGNITPGDALCIYYNWLDGSCEFCDDAGPAAVALQDPAVVTVQEVRYAENHVDVVVAVAGAPSLDAFGLEIEYTDGPLQFVGVIRTETVNNFEQFRATQTSSNRIRIGGFHTSPVDATAMTDMFLVRFAVTDPSATGSIDIFKFVDDLEGATPIHDDVTGTGARPPRYDSYALHQNYPNPFNPDTEIRYEVPEHAGQTRVVLSIYDVKGRLVKTVENRVRSAGEYTIRWSGLNESGEAVSSGVYFYVFRSGKVTLSRKLVLLK